MSTVDTDWTVHMDSSLHNAAIAGNIDAIFSHIKDQPAEQVLDQRTPNMNTILHLASQFGHTKAVQEILAAYPSYPSLLTEVNSNKDSALHLAAKGGHSDVVRALINHAKVLDQDLEIGKQTWLGISQLKNDEGDTALHEGARYNHVEVVSMLLQEDPDLRISKNACEESPLYLAASRGFHDLVNIIIDAGGSPSYSGLNGRTALHGAVICNSEGIYVIVNLFNLCDPDWQDVLIVLIIGSFCFTDCTRKLLEWRKILASEDDDGSQTPLHYAARLGFANLVSKLLLADESIAYVSELHEGNTALLLAASAGHVSVMKEIISLCPNCCYVVNNKGRNVLHVAIEHEQKNVIEYLLEEFPTIISSLISGKDVDGNTPLHLLATSNCFVPRLIQHPLADKGALNKKHLTPLDLVNYDDKLSTPVGKSAIAEELKRGGAILYLPNVLHPPLFPIPPAPIPTASDPPPTHSDTMSMHDGIKKVADNHMLVAALIVTVTFTVGFTMPGGYIQSGSLNQGMAVLSTKSIAFQAFIISDTVAFLFSVIALLIYFYAAICGINPANSEIFGFLAELGVLYNSLALGAMIVTFITGTYTVLQHTPALAIAACVIACITFPTYLGTVERLGGYRSVS
ncbi:hypothetical protein LguiA_026691 [Lonicera macranthoides]